MDDGKKPGCTLTIKFINEDLTLQEFMMWLKLKSGLSKEYVNKILAVKKEDLYFTIAFDSTASYYEADGQLSPLTFYARTNYYDNQIVLQSFGQFAKVTLFTDLNNLDLSSIIQNFEKQGVILELQRLKNNGINTGEIELMMFLDVGSDLLNKHWLSAKENEMKVEQFLPKDYVIEVMHRICDKSGCITIVPKFYE